MHPLATKTRDICRILEKTLGVPEKKRRHADPLESLVLTILSQNTSDINSFRAFDALKARFAGANGKPDWARVAAVPQAELAEVIRSGGLSRQKSQRIQAILNWLSQEYGEYRLDFLCRMDPRAAISLMTEHKGIGVKTVSVVLAFSCGADVFPVDTHVNRLCQRLGLVKANSPAEKTFWAMAKQVPPGKGFSFHLNLIHMGRTICRARKPDCLSCPLTKQCDYFQRDTAKNQ